MERSFSQNNDGYLSNKSLIMDGKFGLQHINALCEAFSPKNESNKFISTLQPEFDVESGEDRMVPGFKLEIPLPTNLCAKFIENSFENEDGTFPLPINTEIKRDEDDKPYLSITSKGDYTSSFRRPGLAIGLHMEQYVKYGAFNMLSQQLAKHRVYDFSPAKEDKPTLTVQRMNSIKEAFSKFKGKLQGMPPEQQLSESRRVYLPKHESIDSMFSENLTEADNNELAQNFAESAKELRNIPSLKLVNDRKNEQKPQEDNVHSMRRRA